MGGERLSRSTEGRVSPAGLPGLVPVQSARDGVLALEMRDVTYSVPGRTLLDGISLSVEKGCSVAIMGASGSGKTTLLNCILGSVRSTGSIRIDGDEVIGARRSRLAAIRSAKLGIVFQHGELLEELTPVENVAVAGLVAGRSQRWAAERARDLLTRLGVPVTDVATGDLSGGERQRTALARALANEPALILADEPTGALDRDNRDAVADVLFAVPRSAGSALIVVTHDAAVARRADVAWSLSDGQLHELEPSG